MTYNIAQKAGNSLQRAEKAPTTSTGMWAEQALEILHSRELIELQAQKIDLLESIVASLRGQVAVLEGIVNEATHNLGD